jgi:D-3-phosphoglycerate dehydrogenase / 2-oxoglutarate reductase
MALRKVLHLDNNHPNLEKGLERLGYENVSGVDWPLTQILDQILNFEGVVIRSRVPLTHVFFEAAKKLRWVARVGAGMENIDLKAAHKFGITCINAPEGNRGALAEHALGMLLGLSNNLIRADREIRNGMWRRESNRGFEIRGMTIGIIGFGHMGSAFSELAASVGLNVLAFDKYKTGFSTEGVKEVPLETIFGSCDIVSLHLPQTQETLDYANRFFFERFKKPIILINTARGAHVNTHDLVDALVSGAVRGACLDVLEYEKADFEGFFDQKLPETLERLLKDDRVIFSPHIAGWSTESSQKMADIIVSKVTSLDANKSKC